MIRIGVDTGGTFTDFVLLDGERVTVHKVRSTPDDPSRGILIGIRELLAIAGRPPDLTTREGGLDVVHGSTVATNAVLERRGARVGLVATEGFEDVLRIGRQTRRELYDFFVPRPRPLVPEGLTFALRERTAVDGDVVEALDESALDALPATLGAAGAESVAVCLLHAYVNPSHEAHVAARLRAAGFTVSASHEVLPEYREFERWSTTVVNAYVTPLMARYLGRLEEALVGARLTVMQSNGGSISAVRARGRAVQTILSGPAAGAVGALGVARAAGVPRVIGFDMGGTSTDVTLLDGELRRTTGSMVGDFPVRLPMIDIHTVGAGGGSIAHVDSGGALRVGPESAGADPGPACYGTGTHVTVTDANLLLGRLDADVFLGGRMALDVERARAIAREFAARLGLDGTGLAHGIVRVANANMERAIRVVSVRRGVDPRDLALLAFGGAGGMHACEIADALGIGTVFVPRHAGVLSALGMLLADVTRDYSRSVRRLAADAPASWLRHEAEPLLARARHDLGQEGFPEQRQRLASTLDVRYVGQSFELEVPLDEEYRDAFHRAHQRLYGYANPARPVEVVNLRVTAVGVTDKPPLPRLAAGGLRSPDPVTIRPAWFGRAFRPTPVHRFETLAAGTAARGPAIIAGGEATVVVPPNYAYRVDEFGNLIARRVRRGAPVPSP